MADNKLLKFSSSPHVRAPRTTRQIMTHVCIALLPAAIMGIVYFGYMAAILIATSVLSAVLSEFIYNLIVGKKICESAKSFDFSSCVTGLLIALSIGVQTPWYAVILANVFAIIVVKMLFGGTGKNLVNPAVTGRVFAFMSFTSLMASGWVAPAIGSLYGATSINPTTGATALTDIFTNGALPTLSNLDLLLGTGLSGCIGETCKVALIAGGIYLAIMGIINIGYPVIYIAVTGLFTVCLNGFDFAYFLPSILSGGLMLGAIFMATDYTTSPNTTLGNIIYFILLGLVTAGLRQATGIEVVSFVILLMNLFVPLIDKFVINKPFGYKKVKKAKGEQAMSKFFKSDWFKCITVLLVLAVVLGGTLALLNDVLYVSPEERTARAIKKIYGVEKEYSITLDVDDGDEAESNEYGTIEKIYTVGEDLLFKSTGGKGYKNGTITLWLKVVKDNNSYKIDKVVLDGYEKQTLMSKFSQSYYDKFLLDVTKAYESQTYIFAPKAESGQISNPMTGATKSANAACNAANAVIQYLIDNQYITDNAGGNA